MATQAETTRGFNLPCPCCSETGQVHVDLADVSQLHCHACDGDFTLADVKALLESWSRAVAWLEAAPPIE